MTHDAPAAKRTHHEQTVTINTKAAFDALNDMFCDALPEGGRGAARGVCGDDDDDTMARVGGGRKGVLEFELPCHALSLLVEG